MSNHKFLNIRGYESLNRTRVIGKIIKAKNKLRVKEKIEQKRTDDE